MFRNIVKPPHVILKRTTLESQEQVEEWFINKLHSHVRKTSQQIDKYSVIFHMKKRYIEIINEKLKTIHPTSITDWEDKYYQKQIREV